ncbi:TPA: signal peptidase I [Candidatus Peregrinibacteria bacterium]|nr:signal peptidase I [Candidatus Peregrinibacteria bacterium]HIQ57810.1 signal peptidase I [Candidatus Gracilibacteria bacterium]
MQKKFQKKLFIISLVCTALVFSGCHKIENRERREKIITPMPTVLVKTCEEKITRERKRISGNSMSPLLQNNDRVMLLHKYYEICEIKPKKGDLIAYDYVGEKIPIIKVLVATSEDFLQIKNNTLWINGEEYKNSGNQKYNFSKGELAMLQLYIKNNHIKKDRYFILGDNISNSRDSRRFGAISSQKILGKFELMRNHDTL